MSRYKGEQADVRRTWDKIGVLLVNLGSPDEPTRAALKRYLKEFLWDPRVVEIPRPLWWLILNGVILQTRPARSAKAYQEVWTDQGSPLIDISKQQLAGLTSQLEQRHGDRVVTALAMRYGNPSIRHGLDQLRRQGVGRVLIFPLYPQYSASTTASVLDAVFAELSGWRLLPEVRTLNRYHQHAGYLQALASSVREHWQHAGQAERLLFSFHGVPKRYLENGDPYYHECLATAEAVARLLQLDTDRWSVTFQSRFGKAEWLQPYTDKTLKEWGRAGVASVDVICPGFSADCLETLEEINQENREYFLESGGSAFHYIPALNARADHLTALADIVDEQLGGWL